MKPQATVELRTERLVLSALQVADAAEMVEVLADPDLYTFTADTPPGLDELEHRYRAQVVGPPREDEAWHNWILRIVGTGTAIGFVQATVIRDSAELAWVVGTTWQRQGFASEAVGAIRNWLVAHGTKEFTAHIRPDHVISGKVATAIGLATTNEVDNDGEVVWRSPRS